MSPHTLVIRVVISDRDGPLPVRPSSICSSGNHSSGANHESSETSKEECDEMAMITSY